MSESVYENCSADTGPANPEKSSHIYEDIYANEDATKTQETKSNKGAIISASEPNTSGHRSYRLAVVCLLTLVVFLLVAITIPWVKLTKERDQIQTIYNNLTAEKEQLETSYTDLIAEKNQLETSYNKLTAEKDQLETSYNKLTAEKNQLETSYNKLTAEKNQLETSKNRLTAEKNQLETSKNRLTAEKNQLETSYNKLTAEKNQLETSKNRLTAEKNQLETSYNKLTGEKNQLETSYNKLTAEKNQLETSKNRLTAEKNQLETNYQKVNKEKDQFQRKADELQRKLSLLGVLHEHTGWRFFSSSIYYLSTEKRSWSESRRDCQRKGADLVIIKDREEQDFVEHLRNGNPAWIGAHDIDNEGDWKWVDGTAVTNGFWRQGEPNNVGEEDCVATGYQTVPVPNWFDHSCSLNYVWICEIRITT